MKKTNSMKEVLLVRKMRADDPVELPMDDKFFDSLHDKIMCAVEKTEIKPVSKWDKTWIFLDQKTAWRSKARKAVKLSIAAVTMTVGVSLLSLSLNFYQQAQYVREDLNKKSIIEAAEKNPAAWSELMTYQNENDFYSEVLSQRDVATFNDVDQVLSQSL
jgi:hypothetical protein